MKIIILVFFFLHSTQAFLPDSDNCCKNVRVRGGSFFVNGRYHLGTYNGSQGLIKEYSWSIAMITYSDGRWILKEMVERGETYFSDPTNQTCPENVFRLKGGLWDDDLEVLCTLALPWYYMLLFTMASLLILVATACCFYICCCCSSR